jgi:hypothetical protein
MTPKTPKASMNLATLAAAAQSRGRSWMRSDECLGVATHCGCCGHPLKDAYSVQVACGPDCRERYGFENPPTNPDWAAAKIIANNFGVPEDAVVDWSDARVVCNLFLHIYALDAENQPWCVLAVDALGYSGLASRMAQRRDEFIARAAKRAEKEAALAKARAEAAKKAGMKRGNSYTRPEEPQEVRITVETVSDTFRGRTTQREVLTVRAPFSTAFNASPVKGRWFDRTVKAWRVPVESKKDLWNAIRGSFKGLPLISDQGTTQIPQ